MTEDRWNPTAYADEMDKWDNKGKWDAKEKWDGKEKWDEKNSSARAGYPGGRGGNIGDSATAIFNQAVDLGGIMVVAFVTPVAAADGPRTKPSRGRFAAVKALAGEAAQRIKARQGLPATQKR